MTNPARKLVPEFIRANMTESLDVQTRDKVNEVIDQKACIHHAIFRAVTFGNFFFFFIFEARNLLRDFQNAPIL